MIACVSAAAVYQFCKDFAGPVAIIIASIAATGINYSLGKKQIAIASAQRDVASAQRDIAQGQKDIAQGQKDIALDKLKHDLFDKRYEIYQAAKLLIETLISDLGTNKKTDPKIRELRLKLDEARFFFPPDTRAFCETIEKYVFDLLVASRAASGYSDDNPERQKARKQESDAVIALAGIYETLAQKFERDLGFDQLTKIG